MARLPCASVAPPGLILKAIAECLTESFGLPEGSLSSRSREQRVAFMRQLAMYLGRKLTGQSYPVIGRYFGRRHASVIYACRLMEKRVGRRLGFRQSLEQLERAIAASAALSGESLPMMFCTNAALDDAVGRLLGPVVVELLNDPAVQEVSANFAAGRMRLFADYGSGPMREIPAELAPQALIAVARLLATAMSGETYGGSSKSSTGV